jgi:hypothetical protein
MVRTRFVDIFAIGKQTYLTIKTKQGELKHLYRSTAFVMSRLYPENGGIFVCKARHLLLAGARNSDLRGTTFRNIF